MILEASNIQQTWKQPTDQSHWLGPSFTVERARCIRVAASANAVSLFVDFPLDVFFCE